MQVFESKSNIILSQKSSTLFCDRSNGALFVKEIKYFSSEWNPNHLGNAVCFLGKIRFHSDGDWHLLLVRSSQKICELPHSSSHIYQVKKVCFIPLSMDPLPLLDLEDLQENFKQQCSKQKKEITDRIRFEMRMKEEICRLFSEDNQGGFYYCFPNGDLTNSLQRQNLPEYLEMVKQNVPIWQLLDIRFFWNESLLSDLLDSHLNGQFSTDLVQPFIVPIIQGFVEPSPRMCLFPEHEHVNSDTTDSSEKLENVSLVNQNSLQLWLISRRCKFKPGYRFRRRGVNSDGHVSNYVETEQILKVHTGSGPHYISFIQIRGSIPIFWSQSGMKYKPPIRLEQSFEENLDAFSKHMNEDINRYGSICVVSLLNSTPNRCEKKLSDAYLHYQFSFNSSKMTHVLFDFHDFCSGTSFENLSCLIQGLMPVIKEQHFCWLDTKGIINKQVSIFRVNCMDCLDRTNVVQMLLATVVLEIQLRKLGMLSPDEEIPPIFHKFLANLWGNNGDAISTQYAGTIAMKGDYTRTGERTATGLVRDGISSVNRYYLRFREISKQGAIDLFTRTSDSPELQMLLKSADESTVILREKEENLRQFVRHCSSLCTNPDLEANIAECILIACDEREKETRDLNSLLMITSKFFYIIRVDRVFCAKIPIESISRIEIGLQPALFRSRVTCLRIFYYHKTQLNKDQNLDNSNVENFEIIKTGESKFDDMNPNNNSSRRNSSVNTTTPSSNQSTKNDSEYFVTFRQPNLRLFNNILINIRDEEEAMESLKAVSMSFQAAASFQKDLKFPFVQRDSKLDRLSYSSPPKEYLLPQNIVQKIYETQPEIVPRKLNPFRRSSGFSQLIKKGKESNLNSEIHTASRSTFTNADNNKLPNSEISLPFPWSSLSKELVQDPLKSMKNWSSEFSSKFSQSNTYFNLNFPFKLSHKSDSNKLNSTTTAANSITTNNNPSITTATKNNCLMVDEFHVNNFGGSRSDNNISNLGNETSSNLNLPIADSVKNHYGSHNSINEANSDDDSSEYEADIVDDLMRNDLTCNSTLSTPSSQSTNFSTSEHSKVSAISIKEPKSDSNSTHFLPNSFHFLPSKSSLTSIFRSNALVMLSIARSNNLNHPSAVVTSQNENTVISLLKVPDKEENLTRSFSESSLQSPKLLSESFSKNNSSHPRIADDNSICLHSKTLNSTNNIFDFDNPSSSIQEDIGIKMKIDNIQLPPIEIANSPKNTLRLNSKREKQIQELLLHVSNNSAQKINFKLIIF